MFKIHKFTLINSRHPSLDVQLTRERHKSEVRSLLKCKQIGVRVPTMYLCDTLTNTIVMERLEQGSTAKTIIDQHLVENNVDSLTSLAADVGVIVARMHRAGLIHGDITTSNILVNNNQLVMIDFGLSFQVKLWP